MAIDSIIRLILNKMNSRSDSHYQVKWFNMHNTVQQFSLII